MAGLPKRVMATTLVAVVAATIGTSVPAFAADAYSEETAGFARERGISLDEAELRLTWQSLAPDLLETLEPALGERFGGVWVDVRDGDRVKVGVTGRVDEDAVAAIRRTAESLGLNAGYDIVAVARSQATLDAGNAWLGAEIARVNDDARAPLSAGLRTDLNAIALHVPPADAVTPAQRALVDTARARLGAGLLVDSAANAYDHFACAYPYCDSPLRGGVKIYYPGVTSCTAGFAAKSKVDDRLYLMTSGHCLRDNYSWWKTKDSGGTEHTIGSVWHWQDNAYYDAGILTIENPGWWNPQGRVVVTWSPWTTPNSMYTIQQDKLNVVGNRICTTGWRTGMSWCGEVTEVGYTANVEGMTRYNLGRSSVCSMGGDSGAPMYSYHIGYGLLIGGNSGGGCDTIFQGIRGAENILNVNVLHSF